MTTFGRSIDVVVEITFAFNACSKVITRKATKSNFMSVVIEDESIPEFDQFKILIEAGLVYQFFICMK